MLLVYNEKEFKQLTMPRRFFKKKIFIKPDIHKHNLKKNYIDLSFKAIN